MTISSNLPDIVDAYITIRAQRLVLDKQVTTMKDMEKVHYDHLIASFREQGLSALGGVCGVVKMHRSEEPQCDFGPGFYEYVVANNAWDLLHRRLTVAAVEARWEDGAEIPGVTKYEKFKLSVSTK